MGLCGEKEGRDGVLIRGDAVLGLGEAVSWRRSGGRREYGEGALRSASDWLRAVCAACSSRATALASRRARAVAACSASVSFSSPRFGFGGDGSGCASARVGVRLAVRRCRDDGREEEGREGVHGCSLGVQLRGISYGFGDLRTGVGAGQRWSSAPLLCDCFHLRWEICVAVGAPGSGGALSCQGAATEDRVSRFLVGDLVRSGHTPCCWSPPCDVKCERLRPEIATGPPAHRQRRQCTAREARCGGGGSALHATNGRSEPPERGGWASQSLAKGARHRHE